VEYDRRKLVRISSFLSEFLANCASNYSSKTLAMYSYSLKSLISIIGDKPMKFVTVKDVERYKTERVKVVSPVSVNVDFRTLRAAFNVALAWKMVDVNVFTKSKLLRLPERLPAYLSREDFDHLLRFVDDEQFKILLIFAVSTMMRRGEIANLEWTDVDMKGRVIHIRSKEGFTVKGGRTRHIPMTDRIYHLLNTMRARSSFVFSMNDGRRLKEEYLTRKFKAYVRRAGLPESLHFHSTRHTGASWLVQQDVPLYAVQKLLGHSSPAVTQIYSHLTEENLRKAIEQIVPATYSGMLN
jgi:integrase